MSPLPQLIVVFGGGVRRWRGDMNAAAAVEFALIAPAMLMMMAMIVFGGEGFEVQRKVTMTMRTLTDLVTQQCDIGPNQPTSGGSSSYAAPCPSTVYYSTDITAAASIVMTPYDVTPLQFTIAEIQTNGSASGTGVQVWCKNSSAATTYCPGATFPANLSSSAYLIYGHVQYTYSPLGLWFQSANVTFSDSYYMLPRIAPASAPGGTALTNNGQPYVACTGC